MLPAWNLTDLYKTKTDPQIKLDQEFERMQQQFAQKYS